MAKKYQAPIERRPLLDPRKKETMLMVLIRNQRAHEAVRELLKPKHVRSMGEGYAILWKVVCDFYARHQSLPPRDLIMDDVQNVIAARADDLDEAEVAELEAFLDLAFEGADQGKGIGHSPVHREEAIATAKLFLEEVLAAQLLDSAGQNNTVPVDLPALLQRAHSDAMAAASIVSAADADDCLCPPGWDTRERVPLRSTGLSIFDHFLGGGDLGGEVMVLMGPLGSCKTLTCVQGAACAIKQANMRWRNGETGGKVPKVFFVSTEVLRGEFRDRIISYLATVPVTRLAQMASIEDLCKADEPGATEETRYELRFFDEQLRVCEFQSEYRRVCNAAKMLNKHGVFIDFTSANSERPNAGYGGIAEVAQIVKAKLRQYNDTAVPYTFWLDHAAALASRIIEAGADRSELRHILRAIPLQCRDLLGVPYNQPVWIAHQLSGVANSKGPVADIDHTDADECKQFAMFANFAVVIGRPNEEQLCKIRCTKHRRQPPREYGIIQVDGLFSRVRNMSESYAIDACQGKIRPVSEINQVVPGDAPLSQRRVRGPEPHAW